jgi:hypothetical protein
MRRENKKVMLIFSSLREKDRAREWSVSHYGSEYEIVEKESNVQDFYIKILPRSRTHTDRMM